MSKISIRYRAALGRVCMKLVIVMGVTWIIDVISWAVGGQYYIWYVTDVINALQGLFIFLVVGLQPQVCLCLFSLFLFVDKYLLAEYLRAFSNEEQ